MGWKGTLRSVRAAARHAERAAQRQHREHLRQEKATARRLEIAQATSEVESYESHLATILTLHRSCSSPNDWLKQSKKPEPTSPLHQSLNEASARDALESYEPSWWDRLLNRQNQKLAGLEAAIEQARFEDERALVAAQSRWQTEHGEWAAATDLAQRVVRQEPEAMHRVLETQNGLAQIEALGSTISFVINDSGIHATLEVHGSDIVPQYAKTQLRSGRLSVRDLPKSKYHAFYQDHVCSCVLRLAREIFALLPVDEVIVTAVDEGLDEATGHLVDIPILSIFLPRATLRKLNLQAIDPSESMQNFVHRMKFQKTRGLSAIEPITWQQVRSP